MSDGSRDETYEDMVSGLATATTTSERAFFLRAVLRRLQHDGELLAERLGQIRDAARAWEVGQ